MRPAAIVWFTRKNYVAHRALDPDGLPPTFDEWRALVGHRSARNVAYRRVVFSPGHFAAWCRAEGRDIDASARTAFAADRRRTEPTPGWSGAV